MLFKTTILIFLLISTVFSKEFTVASYNVENLFDLVYDKSEYKEYIPNTNSLWNKNNYRIKLNNISFVINNLKADLIVLQEIESLKSLLALKKKTNFKYHHFYKRKKSAVGLALLSNFKILKTKILKINNIKYSRDIVKYTIKIQYKTIDIFNNHWPSKRQKENKRIQYASVLKKELKKYQNDDDYILLGDFNSNYNEKESLKLDKDLNNTYGITALNDILKSSSDIKKKYHYNLWYELKYQNRFSSFYKNKKITPDNILLPFSLFDTKKISYIQNSFTVHKYKYLFKNNKIFRWKMKNNYSIHDGSGFSDHLAISAKFTTSSYIKPTNSVNFNINKIYSNKMKTGLLKNVLVIYKNKNNYIIKQKDNKAIYIYNSKLKLYLGNTYNLYVNKIVEYYGLKEIKSFDIKRNLNTKIDYKKYYLDANKINLHDIKEQNEVIKNLKGTYNKGYLYYKKDGKTKKIKLYSKIKEILPQNGQNIIIMQAHLSYFKNKTQIIINQKSDYNAY